VIAVMQDINLAALFCQYLILMKNGRVVHHGPCEQVLTESTIQSVFQVKSKVYEDTYANARQVVFNRSSHVP
jgi:iron complex transport system ATP-binding protein